MTGLRRTRLVCGLAITGAGFVIAVVGAIGHCF
jgi:hypothetical protein